MKKFFTRFLIFTLCLTFIFAFFGLSGCTPNVGELSEEKQIMIKQDFLESIGGSSRKPNKEDITVNKYYGTYNGSVVVMMDVATLSYDAEEKNVEIDGVTFLYRDSNRILAWSEGKFRDLALAYDLDFFSKDDLEKVRDIHNDGGTHTDDPILDEPTEDVIIDDYLEWINLTETTLDDIFINGYFGSYGDSVALMISSSNLAYTAEIREVRIAGLLFVYPNGQSILIWKDGTFYGLEEAYEQALISWSDLRNICNAYRNRKK